MRWDGFFKAIITILMVIIFALAVIAGCYTTYRDWMVREAIWQEIQK